jgi:hypothetical protein
VLPHTRHALRGVGPEEVAERRQAESGEMLIRPKKRWLRVESNAGLFKNLADRRLDQALVLMNASRRHLRSRLGMVSMVEDQQPVFAFDVDDYSLPDEGHPRDRRSCDGIVACASVRE